MSKRARLPGLPASFTGPVSRRLKLLNQRSRQAASLRLLFFCAAFGVYTYLRLQSNPAALWAGGALLLLFFLLVFIHSRIEEQVVYYRALSDLASLDEYRRNRELDRGRLFTDPEFEPHAVIHDLDLAGEHSLWRMLDLSCSHEGTDELKKMFTAPLTGGNFKDSRDHARLVAAAPTGEAGRRRPVLSLPAGQSTRAGLLPLLWAASLAFTTSQFISGGTMLRVAMLVQLAVFAFTWFRNREIELPDSSVLVLLRSLIRQAGRRPWHSELLAGHAASFQAADRAILKAGLLVRAWPPSSALLLRFLLNMSFFYEYFLQAAFLRWVRVNHAKVNAATGALATFDCLLAQARFEKLFAAELGQVEIDDVNISFEGDDLRHPLITHARGNPCHLDKKRSVFLLTGSNMAGKSTYLRSVGQNSLLCLAGSLPFGRRLKTGLFNLLSVMRLEDSVKEGASYFYAEVGRVKAVLESLADAPGLVLLDELLRGTNHHERHIAVTSLIRHLEKTECLVILASHDLSLTRQEWKKVSYGHFREEVVEGQLEFDYRLHDGPLESGQTNALRILEREGLPVDRTVG